MSKLGVTRLGRVALALVLALGAIHLALATALAETSPAKATSMKLSGAASPSAKAKGQYILTATLTSQDGKPVNGREVEFYQQVALVGTRDSYLGAATTDATGVAAIAYQPAQPGRQTIKARFAGDNSLAESEATSALDVAQVAPLFPDEPKPLAVVGVWLPYVLGAVVLAVWIVLLTVLFRTVRGIRGAVTAPQPGRQPTVPALTSNVRRLGDAG